MVLLMTSDLLIFLPVHTKNPEGEERFVTVKNMKKCQKNMKSVVKQKLWFSFLKDNI